MSYRAHTHYGHMWPSQRHERQADAYAAWLLISPAEWALATRCYETPLAVAASLGVLPRLVEVYARERVPWGDALR